MSETTKDELKRGELTTGSGRAQAELENVDVQDVRLKRRTRRVTKELSQQPEYPITLARDDAAATKGVY